MAKITTENFKLENLMASLRQLSNQKGLGYKNLLELSRLSTLVEGILKPYLEIKRDVSKKYTIVDKDTGKNILDETKQEEYIKEMEALAQDVVEFEAKTPIVINVKDDSFLDLVMVRGFMDVFGEKDFQIISHEQPTVPTMPIPQMSK